MVIKRCNVVRLGQNIGRHGSAVYVGMVVVVCMLYYKQKVALLLNSSKNRHKKPLTRKGGCTVYRANLTTTHACTVVKKVPTPFSVFRLFIITRVCKNVSSKNKGGCRDGAVCV